MIRLVVLLFFLSSCGNSNKPVIIPSNEPLNLDYTKTICDDKDSFYEQEEVHKGRKKTQKACRVLPLMVRGKIHCGVTRSFH